jgi:hypothetical protein
VCVFLRPGGRLSLREVARAVECDEFSIREDAIELGPRVRAIVSGIRDLEDASRLRTRLDERLDGLLGANVALGWADLALASNATYGDLRAALEQTPWRVEDLVWTAPASRTVAVSAGREPRRE